MVPPTGIEPVIFGMRTRCPGPLDDGGTLKLYHAAGTCELSYCVEFDNSSNLN